jgi:hypothetical protein
VALVIAFGGFRYRTSFNSHRIERVAAMGKACLSIERDAAYKKQGQAFA